MYIINVNDITTSTICCNCIDYAYFVRAMKCALGIVNIFCELLKRSLSISHFLLFTNDERCFACFSKHYNVNNFSYMSVVFNTEIHIHSAKFFKYVTLTMLLYKLMLNCY